MINFNHVIGIGKVGYNNVLEAFTNNKIVSFAIVMIVNLLHEKLLRLVIVLCCTCNWVALHPLQEGESIDNLVYYNLIMSDDDVIQALIDRFRSVQNMLTMLNIKDSPTTRGHDSLWFNEPWKVEQDDLKHLVYVPF